MELYLKLIDVIAPVFFVIGIGYYLGKKNPEINTNFITTFAGNVGTPAMIFYTITTTGVSLSVFTEYFIYALIIIGGFSLGGMNAIRYVELSKENPNSTSINPVAVYGIDPPLDLARIYYSFKRIKELNFSEVAVNEAKDYLAKLNKQFGGSPKEVPNIYSKNSMYSKKKKGGGNAKFLMDTPIRIYSDPDIDWHLKERHTDLYDINALDQTAMINELRISGNKDAEFINALGKGYRLNGMRHPHSWSLAEPNELMDWIIEKLNRNGDTAHN